MVSKGLEDADKMLCSSHDGVHLKQHEETFLQDSLPFRYDLYGF